MPFVKGKNNKAVWRHEPTRVYKSNEEAVKDYIRREKRWYKGHDGLDGDHYMYLTEFAIRARVKGERVPVDFRPADAELIFPWLRTIEDGPKDGLWFTQRGAGKSTIMSGFLPMRTAIKFPGSLQIMTSDSVKTTTTNFQDKLKPAYESMYDAFRPSLKSAWPTAKEDDQLVEFGIRRRGQLDKGSGSVIKSIETAQGPKSPAKLEGEGVIKYYVDELFKHPFPDDVYSRGDPLTKTYMTKEGCAYFFGSLSDKNARGREKAVELIKNAGTLGIEFLFMDATWVNPMIEQYDDRGNKITSGPGMYVDCRDENGYVDRKKARREIERNYKILERCANPKFALEYKLKYPLDLETMLDLAVTDYWTPEEVECANAQKNRIYYAMKDGNYEEVDQPALVHMTPSANRNEAPQIHIKYGVPRESARYFIFEEYVHGRTYGMGTDTIPFNTPNDTGNSDHASVIKCFDTNQYVAAYIDRSYDAKYIANNCINMQLLYGGCENLVEMNSIGALKTAYEIRNAQSMLAYTPSRFRPKGPAGFIQKGLNKDRNAMELTQLVRDYSVENMDLIFFWRYFEEFYGFPIRNSDFMSAMAMAEALHEEYRTIKKISESRPQSRPNTVTYGWNAEGQRIRTSNPHNGIMKDGTLDLSHIFKPMGK
jgi:hypothetical protein